MYHIKDVKVFLEVLDQEIQQGHQTHQEYQLTDVLQEMIHQGSRFSTFTVDKWFDCGKPEVLLATNAMLLDKEGYATDPASDSYDNSIIIHPVSIGPNCTLQNTIVGPHVTIGQNTQIINSIISDSIIGSYAGIEDVVLRKSIVGSDSAIKGRGTSLNIGDNTEIDL
jgi:glucose-1-phosphate thymidylyltransferase